MPPVTRVGDTSTGHDACPPQPAVSGQVSFTVSGRPVVREGDRYAEHRCPDHAPHPGKLAAGAPFMSVGGHPIGRVGDPVNCGGQAAQVEGSFSVGNEGGEENRALAYEMLREQWAGDVAGDEERTLLCLPDIADAMAARAGGSNDAQGWSHLARFFRMWFGSGVCEEAENRPDALWVDMAWILSYRRARSAYDDLTDPEYLFSRAAQNELSRMLRRDGVLSGEPARFDYTSPSPVPAPGDKPWRAWKSGYFQRLTANIRGIVITDGLTACMGNFDFRALAAGHAVPLPDGGHRITVEKVCVFVWDSFNFQEKEDGLGYWSCARKDFSRFLLGRSYEFIANQSFRNFRAKFHHGGDFMVLSRPEVVEKFKEFSYDTQL